MKRSSLFTNVLCVLLLVAAGLAATAHAITYTWDVLPGTVDPGNGQIDDGPGTWDAADANNWTIDGGANNIKWADGSDAVFGTGAAGTAGVVTITGTVSTPSVTFNKAFDATSYSLTGGTLTLTGAATVTTDGATNGIASNITGAVGLTKAGAGTLTLSGAANAYTGLTTVSAGTLAYGIADAITAGNDVTVDGATAIMDIAGFNGSVGAVILANGGSITGTGGILTGTSLDVRKGSISAILGGSGALNKSTGDTVILSGANTHSGVTTVTGGTLQYSNAPSILSTATATGSIVINGGDISIDDGVKLTPTGAAGITFSSANAIGKTGTTGAIGFVTQTSTLTVTADPGITGTISANIGDLATAGAFAGAGNKIAKLGSAKLTLAGNTVLVGDVNSNLNAGFTVDGGGELEITGALKAASTLQSNRGNFTNTVGATTANNTLTISGVSGSSVYAGGMTIGGSTFGGNSVVISRPGTQLTPSYKMAANGAQLNLGVSSSNNSLTVSNGAYLYTTQGGGTMTWTIGTNAGANNNSILITGAGSTIDRTGGAGSAINVGAAGDNNSITISAGGKLRPRRFAISTNGGDNNYVLITGSGSTLDNNESNSRLTVASAAGSLNNRLVVENGGFANFINGGAAQCSIGSVTGADNNYIRVDGINIDSTKSSFTLKNPNPLTIGGTITTTPFVDSLASGNHLDVWNGATTSHNSVYVMGVGSAFNLGNGTTVSTPSEATVAASTGNAAYAAGITLYNADSRLNIENGRLIAGADGALVSGPGAIVLNGPAYFSTIYAGSTIGSTSSGTDTPITGPGSLTKEGEGSLIIYGAHDYTGETIVQSGGTLDLEQVGLDDAAAVKIEKVGTVYGKIYIGFSISDVVGALWLGGVEMVPGKYNVTNQSNYFSGTTDGWLEVKISNVPGDTNNDGVVDAADYIAVKQNFGMPATLGAEQGDFDKDGTVDWDDLQILMANFGTRSVGEAPAVPEPGSAILLMFGAAALLRRRAIIGRTSR